MTKTIPLSRGVSCVVDDEDYQHLSQFRWYAKPIDKDSSGFYAVRGVDRRTIYMHRAILRPDDWQLVDHVNRNGLDNRKSNLRLCDSSENVINRIYSQKSGYRGVFLHQGKYWRAQIERSNKRYSVGSHQTAEAAARAYDIAAISLHGDFAVTNFDRSEYPSLTDKQIGNPCDIFSFVDKHMEYLSYKRPFKRKEVCEKGHPFQEGNLYIAPSGRRDCKECRREAVRRYRRKCKQTSESGVLA